MSEMQIYLLKNPFLVSLDIKLINIGNKNCPMNQTCPNNFQEAHGIVLSVAWFVFTNIAVWATYFKSRPYAIYLHIFCVAISSMLMMIGPIMMIVQYGPSIILFQWFHQLIGFILYCILPLLLLSGSICKISKQRPDVAPEQVYSRNKGHSIFGWVYILFIHVPMLTGWFGGQTNYVFGFIIIVDIFSYGVFFYLKFFKKRIQANSINNKLIEKSCRQIKSHKDLGVYSENYFIFANYVYSISNVIGSHPGGWNIIEAVRGREVDRFLYGVDPIEKFDVPRVSHSFNSINLAGPPLAVLAIPPTYPLQQLNQVKVSYMYCHDKAMSIHTIYFDIGNQARFQGYTSLSQIGQYYSLTVNSQLTRLYTAVNFLQPANMTLIDRISKNGVQISKNFYTPHEIAMTNQEHNLNAELADLEKEHSSRNLLPLLVKKYSNGKLTSLFLFPHAKISSIVISQPRGLGLALDCVTSKNVVIFAGGTGLYPYSDLIDLLFKAKLVREGHQLSGMILESNPLLKKKPFQEMSFTFYIAVNELSELHPITLYQCNQLSKSQNFKSHAKIKGVNLQQLKQNYKNIGIISDRFQKLISKQLLKDPDTVFFTCGPVRFTKSLVLQLQAQKVSSLNYKIV